MASQGSPTGKEFLRNCGEMGALILAYPWKETSLGEPEQWPFSLRVALGNMLPSKFPMYLFWGPDLISFYNDAYRPSLGNTGKHPWAIGKPGAEVFAEIWPTVKPMMDSILAGGEAVLNEDLLLPIYRNDTLEDVYWTFCFSRALDDDGSIAGILVICQETTRQIEALTTLETTNSKLVKSEERFRTLVQAAPIAMALLTGRDLIIEEPNEVFLAMLGKNKDIAGKPLGIAMPELNGQPFLKLLGEVFTTGKRYDAKCEPWRVTKEGVETDNIYDFSYVPLFNELNEVYAILETAIDVTSQELSKSIIEKSETDLRNLIMQAPVAMGLLMGRDYILHIGNEKIFELWGRDGSLIINQPIFSALPEARGQGLEDLLENVFKTGIAYKGYELPISLPRSNGVEIVYINFVYDAFRNVEGEITGIMLVGTDVTEQVNARQLVEKSKIELQHTTNRLQLAIEAGELGLFELNLLDEGLISSDRFKEIFETSANAKFYDTLALVHPEDLHTREEAHRLSKETGILDYTARLQFPGNRTKWVMIKGLLTFDENHTAQTILGIVQDISKSKELEFQKDSFLGIASHELKTPVTSIKAFTQVMQSIFEASGELKYAAMMGKIDKQVNKLTYLISDLLDVTKINSGKLEFNNSTFNFDEMVAEVVQDIQIISQRHKIICDLNFNEKFTSDRDRLTQVVINLINNANKYSPDATEIRISTERKEQEIILCVQDYGIGIAEEKQARIFEQFYRVSGTKEHTFPGLGLGLYISWNTIIRMGGRIWVRSVEGAGSTFCFSLPTNN